MAQKKDYGCWKDGHPLWRLLKLSPDVLGVGVLVLFLFIAYGTLPNRWYHSLYVYSDSMSPAIVAGDVIIISPPPETLKIGMIVTLRVDNSLVTHRIIDLQPDGKVTTKGDANIMPDDWGAARVKLVGLYRTRIPLLGYGLSAVRGIFHIQASGAWFVDRETIKLKASLKPKKALVTGTASPTLTATFTPEPGDLTPIGRFTKTPQPTAGIADPSETATPTPTPLPTENLPAEPTATYTFTPTATEVIPPTSTEFVSTATPEPVLPDPTEPIPTESKPTEPEPEKPAPTAPPPTEPAPTSLPDGLTPLSPE